MPSYLVVLDVQIFACVIIYIPTLSVRAAKALTRLCVYTVFVAGQYDKAN